MWTSTGMPEAAAEAAPEAAAPGATLPGATHPGATAPGRVRPPTFYVDGLVAWGTVNAMTLPTLEATGRAGNPQGDTLTGEHEAARTVLDELGRLGISPDAVARKLEAESAGRTARDWQALRAATRRVLDGVAEPVG
jgi:hypothetical protein